jgi:TIR domain-containing protein
MPTVFLSYRRSDTQGEAGRLADVLQLKLGRKFVFRDAISISPGDQFDAVIKAQLATAKIVLVLIGPAWLDELKKRLTQENTDYHRLEVATALQGQKRVIPVLVRGAVLPPTTMLPGDLVALTKCQAITIRDEAWREDADRLTDAIGHPYRWDLFVLRILIAAIVIVVGVWKIGPQVFRVQTSDYAFWRGLVLTLFGIYCLLELFIGYRHFKSLKRLRLMTEVIGS